MHTVKSKYKNPDKFLANLRRQLGMLERRLTTWALNFQKERGAHWFTWAEGVDHSACFKRGDDGAKKAYLGQKVRVEGRIVKYCREDDGEETVHISLGRVNLIDDK